MRWDLSTAARRANADFRSAKPASAPHVFLFKPKAFVNIRRTVAIVVIALVTQLLVGPQTVGHAQSDRNASPRYEIEPPDEPAIDQETVAEMRVKYKTGLLRIENGRWTDALSIFEEIYRVLGNASSLFNVGYCLRAVGRYRDALDVFKTLQTRHMDKLLIDQKREQSQNYLAQSTAFIQELEGRLAHLTVVDVPKVPNYQLRLDGLTLRQVPGRPILIDMDPGAHTVSLEVEGYEPFLWRGALGDGDHRTVRVELKEIERTDISGWVWVGIGAVVLAGLAVGAYFLFRPTPLEAPDGSIAVIRFG